MALYVVFRTYKIVLIAGRHAQRQDFPTSALGNIFLRMIRNKSRWVFFLPIRVQRPCEQKDVIYIQHIMC